MIKLKKNLELFTTFFKIGLFTFGGGYSMIGVIHDTVVNEKKWLTDEEMNQLLTISETTPGPLAINAATFIGYKRSRFLGALFSTLGVVLPSFIIILLISIGLERFKEITIIQNALNGIKAGVIVLILLAFINIARGVKWNKKTAPIFLLALGIVLFVDISIVLIMLAAMIISSFLFLIKNRKNKEFIDDDEEIEIIDEEEGEDDVN